MCVTWQALYLRSRLCLPRLSFLVSLVHFCCHSLLPPFSLLKQLALRCTRFTHCDKCLWLENLCWAHLSSRCATGSFKGMSPLSTRRSHSDGQLLIGYFTEVLRRPVRSFMSALVPALRLPIWWKERTNPRRLSTDLHTCSVICTQEYTHTHHIVNQSMNVKNK